MAGTANAAIAAHGTKLQRDSGGGYVTVADQVEIPAPGLSRPAIEVTHAESPGPASNVSFKEWIAGKVLELKAFTVMISYKPTAATHDQTTGLVGALKSGSNDTYRYVMSDGTYLQFTSLVTDFQILSARTEQHKANVTFQPSGELAGTAWA